MGRATATVVGVVGARGGAGASTVAVALADGLRRAGRRALLVDLATRSGGIDVLLGVDHLDGPRWPDLRAARGSVDGPALAGLLPAWRRVPVLSAHRADPVALDDGIVLDVCAALADACDLLVLDLPRSVLEQRADGQGGADPAALVTACDALLLVTPLDLPSVAGAVAATALATEHGVGRALRLVARRPAPGRLDPWEVSDVVGPPLAAVVGWDRTLAARVDRGDGPDVRPRTPLGRAGAALAAAVGGEA
jgi:secretion/DNA translocation related CpaE-like protein